MRDFYRDGDARVGYTPPMTRVDNKKEDEL